MRAPEPILFFLAMMRELWQYRFYLVCMGLLLGLFAFTAHAAEKSKTDKRWCAWFGALAVPEPCVDAGATTTRTTERRCLQWSEGGLP